MSPAPESPAGPGKLQLSAVQLVASALASVSAAVIASVFGVAGTVIGAALASVVATVGSALYSQSIRRTNAQLRRIRAAGTTPLRVRRQRQRAQGQAAPRPAGELRNSLSPRPRTLRWAAVAASALVVFIAAIAVLTVVELAARRPLSTLVAGHTSRASTSLGALVTGNGGPAASPTPSPTPGPTGGSRPSSSQPGRSVQPTPSAPAGPLVPAPSEATPSPAPTLTPSP